MAVRCSSAKVFLCY